MGYHGVTLPHKFKICVGGCPIKVPQLVDGKIQLDTNQCNNCGRCAGKCPFGAFEEYQQGYKIYIGGRWGKKFAHGQPLSRIFTSEDEVMDVVEKAILLFRDEGLSGERFADTVTRLGFDYVNDKLISGFTSEDEVMDVVEKAILLFRDEGLSGERFADTVTRLGFDYVNDKLISGSIDKTAILSKTVKGGATC